MLDTLARRACLILAGLLLVALAGLAGVRLNGQAELAEANRKHAEFVAGVESRARQTSEAARTEELRRKEAEDETVRIAERAASRDLDAGVRRAAASACLRDRAEYLAVQCSGSGDPGPVGGGAAAVEVGPVLADMLRRTEAAAGEFGAHADAAAAAGNACESAYRGLTRNPS